MGDKKISRRGFLKGISILPTLPNMAKKALDAEFDASACKIESEPKEPWYADAGVRLRGVGTEDKEPQDGYMICGYPPRQRTVEWFNEHRLSACPSWPEGHSCELCTRQPHVYEPDYDYLAWRWPEYFGRKGPR